MALRRLLALVAVLVGAGCSQWSDAVDSRTATAGLPTTLQDLEAHRWVLDGRGPQRPTIAFDDPAIHGSAGCNLFRGRFSLDGQHGIDVDDLSTTRRACPAEVMVAERRFLATLAAVDSVHVDDDHDHLVLRDDHGHRLAFTAG